MPTELLPATWSRAGCPTGVRLGLRWAGAWRRLVDQLTGGQ